MSEREIAGSYDAWAASYDSDANRTRDLDAVVLREVFVARTFAAILEVGCGTGKNTGFLAERGAAVHALDFSAGMLAKAREKVASPRVTWTVADATQPWPLPAASVDLVTCNLVLEHVAHLAPIAAEAARVLRPGGEWFVCELHPCRQYEGTTARFHRGDAVTQIGAFVHHVSDYVQAGLGAGFQLVDLHEHWHATDTNRPPRLLAVHFRLTAAAPRQPRS
jgi:ubiquinone/menaquinone biosynthesis C-methylase UbiE